MSEALDYTLTGRISGAAAICNPPGGGGLTAILTSGRAPA